MSLHRRLFVLTFLFAPMIACLTFSGSYESICLYPKHNYVENNFSNVLWTISNLFISTTGNSPLLVATSDNVTVVAKYVDKNLLSYDLSSGNLAWQNNVSLPLHLTSDETTLFLGGNNQIVLLDSKSGALLDKISLPGVGIITSLYRQNDTFFVYGSAGRFVTYETTEKTQTTSGQNFGIRPFLIEDNVLFVLDSPRFRAIEINTETVLWQTKINEGITKPVFSNDLIFLRTGDPIYTGNIYALEKKTGNIIWEKRANVIGNIEVKNKRVFFLGVEGYLAVLDQQSGQEIARIEFTDGPFNMDLPGREIGGYYLAVDPKVKRSSLHSETVVNYMRLK